MIKRKSSHSIVGGAGSIRSRINTNSSIGGDETHNNNNNNNEEDEDDNNDNNDCLSYSIPLPIQTFLWRQTR